MTSETISLSKAAERHSDLTNLIILSKKDKRYIIDPQLLNSSYDNLGTGTTGRVIKLKCSVERAHHLKVKEFAVKIFHSLFHTNQHSEEFNCYLEIHRRLAQKKDILTQLGITPGTGIEKVPLFAFSNASQICMLKKLYDMDLKKAVGKGTFEDPINLLLAAQQLLEGLLSLMTIGALYFDIKPANILVGRSGKFEVAFTDFEQISFLNFDAKDEQIIKNTEVRMPTFLAHENELNALTDSREDQQAFISQLSKLYAFAMGAAFFEMCTKISLRKFILMKIFKIVMQQNEAPNASIDQFWDEALKTEDKNLGQLIGKIDSKYAMTFFGIINHTIYPDIELMQLKAIQEGIQEQMQLCNAPAFFINMTASLLNTDSGKRMSLQEALHILQANHLKS
jgi:serine/threonine protein kinase